MADHFMLLIFIQNIIYAQNFNLQYAGNGSIWDWILLLFLQILSNHWLLPENVSDIYLIYIAGCNL